MNKLKLANVVLVILLCFSFRAHAVSTQGEFGVEINCGFSFSSLENFNDNFINVFNYGYLNGFSAPVSATAIPGILDANIKLRYSVITGLPIYMRLGFTRLVDTEILHNESSGNDIVTSVASLNTVYAGAGVKYDYKLPAGFSVFIGADAGCYIPVDSYWEVTGNIAENPPVDSFNAYQRIDFTDIYFGGNASAGVEWAVSSGWGVIVEGGYRLAKNPLIYQKTGIFTSAAFDFTELDFSGPYVTGGLVLYFGK